MQFIWSNSFVFKKSSLFMFVHSVSPSTSSLGDQNATSIRLVRPTAFLKNNHRLHISAYTWWQRRLWICASQAFTILNAEPYSPVDQKKIFKMIHWKVKVKDSLEDRTKTAKQNHSYESVRESEILKAVKIILNIKAK